MVSNGTPILFFLIESTHQLNLPIFALFGLLLVGMSLEAKVGRFDRYRIDKKETPDAGQGDRLLTFPDFGPTKVPTSSD
jgi:hypothetical protein